MKNAMYLLNHQSFCGSVRRCVPVVFVSLGNNFFAFFCKARHWSSGVCAPNVAIEVRIQQRALTVRRTNGVLASGRHAMQFNISYGKRWRRLRKKKSQLKPAAWKFEYRKKNKGETKCIGKMPGEYHTACRHSDSIKNYSNRSTIHTANAECASNISNCCWCARVYTYQSDQTKV